MTRYTVAWQPGAEADLAEIWLAATDRSDITAAVHAIDDALSVNADSQGSSVAEGMRSLNAPPLRVLFVAREADRIADVQLVRRI